MSSKSVVKIKIGDKIFKGLIVDRVYVRHVKKKVRGKEYIAVEKRVIKCIPKEIESDIYILIKPNKVNKISEDLYEIE